MKKSLSIISCIILISSMLYCQPNIRIKNDRVYVNKEYSFDVILVGDAFLTGMGVNEIIVKDKRGEVMFNFIHYSTQNGFSTSTNIDPNGGYQYQSGATFIHYFKVIDTHGYSCEIPYWYMTNRYQSAKYLIDNNLIKNGDADAEAFQNFCSLRGNSFSGGN